MLNHEIKPGVAPRPKKRWGQNFLNDPNIARKIVDCAELKAGDRVLEIGPGKGYLTHHLLAAGAKVTALEIDPDLVTWLRQDKALFPDGNPEPETRSDKENQSLKLIQADALRFPYADLAPGYKVVANLPYNISTPLLFRLLDEKQHIHRMVLMLQKEVAERMCASPGQKSYGGLSIMLQFYADVSLAFKVSPNCFYPQPKVGSAVVAITPLSKTRIPVKDEVFFSKIVKAAFLYRRKRIGNALAHIGLKALDIQTALASLEIDPARRGETFSIAEFAALSDALQSIKTSD